MKTQFTVNTMNEFGPGSTTRTGNVQDTAEETFRTFLNKLPKYLLKQWESIEFEFNSQTFDVHKCLLVETDWDFENSYHII